LSSQTESENIKASRNILDVHLHGALFWTNEISLWLSS